MLLLPLVGAAVAAVALANTEATMFETAGAAAGGVLAPLVPLTSQLLFSDSSVESVALPLANASAGKYLARVCWPASFPADLAIEFNSEANSVVVIGSKEDVVALRAASREVPFDVHLSPIKLGFIPADVIPAIQSITGVAILAGCLAYTFLTFV